MSGRGNHSPEKVNAIVWAYSKKVDERKTLVHNMEEV
jgi:hypothetical protein